MAGEAVTARSRRPATVITTPEWSPPGADGPPAPNLIAAPKNRPGRGPHTTTTDTRPTMTQPVPAPDPSGAPNPHPINVPATSIEETSGGSKLRPALVATTPVSVALDGPTSPAPIDRALPDLTAARGTRTAGRQVNDDTPMPTAAGIDTPDPAAEHVATPERRTLLDPALALAADILDDLERVRIANQNRLRQLTRTEPDKDGEERGFGLPPEHPDVIRLTVMVDTLTKVEHDATLNLQRKMRQHPLAPWVKAQRGIGDKQAARLLAAIGDPYINSATGMPRTVSALWAYCGFHTLPVGQTADDTPKELAGRAQLPADQTDADQTDADTQKRNVGGIQPPTSQRDRDTPNAPAGGARTPANQAVGDDRVPLVGRTQSLDGHCEADTRDDCAVGDRPRDPDQALNDTQRALVRVAARRRRGERANWSSTAKTRAYLIAESCLKQLSPTCRDGHWTSDTQSTTAVPAPDPQTGDGQLTPDTQTRFAVPVCACSPYRIVYDRRRAHTAITNPDWTDGHSHNDALRIAAKTILKHLWRAARTLHHPEEDQP